MVKNGRKRARRAVRSDDEIEVNLSPPLQPPITPPPLPPTPATPEKEINEFVPETPASQIPSGLAPKRPLPGTEDVEVYESDDDYRPSTPTVPEEEKRAWRERMFNYKPEPLAPEPFMQLFNEDDWLELSQPKLPEKKKEIIILDDEIEPEPVIEFDTLFPTDPAGAENIATLNMLVNNMQELAEVIRKRSEKEYLRLEALSRSQIPFTAFPRFTFLALSGGLEGLMGCVEKKLYLENFNRAFRLISRREILNKITHENRNLQLKMTGTDTDRPMKQVFDMRQDLISGAVIGLRGYNLGSEIQHVAKYFTRTFYSAISVYSNETNPTSAHLSVVHKFVTELLARSKFPQYNSDFERFVAADLQRYSSRQTVINADKIGLVGFCFDIHQQTDPGTAPLENRKFADKTGFFPARIEISSTSFPGTLSGTLNRYIEELYHVNNVELADENAEYFDGCWRNKFHQGKKLSLAYDPERLLIALLSKTITPLVKAHFLFPLIAKHIGASSPAAYAEEKLDSNFFYETEVHSLAGIRPRCLPLGNRLVFVLGQDGKHHDLPARLNLLAWFYTLELSTLSSLLFGNSEPVYNPLTCFADHPRMFYLFRLIRHTMLTYFYQNCMEIKITAKKVNDAMLVADLTEYLITFLFPYIRIIFSTAVSDFELFKLKKINAEETGDFNFPVKPVIPPGYNGGNFFLLENFYYTYKPNFIQLLERRLEMVSAVFEWHKIQSTGQIPPWSALMLSVFQ